MNKKSASNPLKNMNLSGQNDVNFLRYLHANQCACQRFIIELWFYKCFQCFCLIQLLPQPQNYVAFEFEVHDFYVKRNYFGLRFVNAILRNHLKFTILWKQYQRTDVMDSGHSLTRLWFNRLRSLREILCFGYLREHNNYPETIKRLMNKNIYLRNFDKLNYLASSRQ